MPKSSARTGHRSPSAQASDRRRSPRTPIVLQVDYSTVDSFFSEFTRDVNEGGMYIESEAPAPVDTLVSLYFALPGTDEPVKVEGRVMWSRGPDESDSPGMGIQFENLDTKTREQINEVVRRLRAG